MPDYPSEVAAFTRLQAGEATTEDAILLFERLLRDGYGTLNESYRQALVLCFVELGRAREAEHRLRIALHLLAAEAQGQVAHGRTERERAWGRRVVEVVDRVAPLGEGGTEDG